MTGWQAVKDRSQGAGGLRALPEGAAEDFWQAGDGWPIRRLRVPLAQGAAARGSLLFLPGRGDCYEKYTECLGHWRARGLAVTALDWRGQGGSGRLGKDGATGHVPDFAVWLEDLAAFWRQWENTQDGAAPRVLVAHSMGGHLALRAVAEGMIRPDLVILSAPMLGFHAPGLPLGAQRVVAAVLRRLGDPARPAWGGGETPVSSRDARQSLLTHDDARYQAELWWQAQRPFLAMGAASKGWLAAAVDSIVALRRPGLLETVRVPVLLLSTSADRLVSHRANLAAAARLPACELVAFGRECAHEILREADPVRARAMAAIDAFMDAHLAQHLDRGGTSGF